MLTTLGSAADAGSVTVVWSTWISSAGELRVAAGAENVVAAAFEEKFCKHQISGLSHFHRASLQTLHKYT